MRGVQKNKGGLQRKLTIGASNDPLEQEADRVADQVMAAPAHPAVSGAPPHIQRLTEQTTGQADMAAPASVARVLASSGRPLEPSLQQDMGQRFGHDFSRVRVHTDATAERSVRDVNANAYTVGHDIVFGAGQFTPETNEGRRLIAHELTHVVQQSQMSGKMSALQCKGGRGPGSCGLLSEAAATVLGGEAHIQIQSRLASRGYAIEMPIPRATKTDGIGSRKCQPFGTSWGYADVARITVPTVGISEIKPWFTAVGGLARAEAMHYRLRAEQSKQRLTGVGPCSREGASVDDQGFNFTVGPLTATSSFTLLKGAIAGTEDFGPFKGDRNLWAKEVGAGVIGYWCKLNEEGKKKKKEEEEKKKKEKEEKKKKKKEEMERKKKEKEKAEKRER